MKQNRRHFMFDALAATAAMTGAALAGEAKRVSVPDGDKAAVIALELFVGQRAIIEVETNPSTGFRWSIISHAGKAAEIGQGGTHDLPGAKPGMVGQPQRQDWKIEAVTPGHDLIELGYFQPWNKDDLARRLTLKVKVK